MLQWHTAAMSYEIQKRHFSVEKGTYLWISSPTRDHGAQRISWAFTFLDFGMCHTIAGCSTVDCQLIVPDGVSTFKASHAYFVDGDMYKPLDEDEAIRAVFGGHHAHYVAEMYQGMGVSLKFASRMDGRPSRL
jgi:hypothetical protein